MVSKLTCLLASGLVTLGLSLPIRADEASVERTERIMRIFAVSGDFSLIEKIDNVPFDIKKLNDRVFYSLWPANREKEKKDVLIYMNGFESHCGWFSRTARQLSDNGVAVYALDRRGSGINEKLDGTKQAWLSDLEELVSLIEREKPGAEINLSALCFGTRITSIYAIHNQSRLASLIYFSPGIYTKVEPKDRWTIYFSPETEVRGPITDNALFTRDEEALTYIDNDPLRITYAKGQQFLDGKELGDEAEEELEEIELPVLVFLGGKDEVVDINKTRKLFRKLKKVKFIENPEWYHSTFFQDSHKDELLEWLERN